MFGNFVKISLFNLQFSKIRIAIGYFDRTMVLMESLVSPRLFFYFLDFGLRMVNDLIEAICFHLNGPLDSKYPGLAIISSLNEAAFLILAMSNISVCARKVSPLTRQNAPNVQQLPSIHVSGILST